MGDGGLKTPMRLHNNHKAYEIGRKQMNVCNKMFITVGSGYKQTEQIYVCLQDWNGKCNSAQCDTQ